MHLFPLCLAFIASVTEAASIGARACGTVTPAYAPTWFSGYSGKVLINGLSTPRGMIIDSLGSALVVESGRGVRFIKLTSDTGLNVCVSSSKTLISDTSLNHGIELSADGKTLFVSNPTTVFSYNYDPSSGTASNKRTIITGMGDGGHVTRTLTVLKKSNPDVLLVQVGSNGNNDTSAMDVNSGRAQIRYFSVSTLKSSTVSFMSGKLVGWGLRNDVGVTEHPQTGGVWSVENSMDQVTRDNGKSTTDVHNTNPGEELNYLGTYPFSNPSNYGYPTCVAAWDPTAFKESNPPKTGQQFAQSIFNDASCASKKAPTVTFAAHNAPLDIKFRKDGKIGYVSFHGSWNRQPPDGYRLSRMLFNNAGTPIVQSNSQWGAIPVMSNPDLTKCPNSCFRPVGLAFDDPGRLYMTSDSTGELWVISGV